MNPHKLNSQLLRQPRKWPSLAIFLYNVVFQWFLLDINNKMQMIFVKILKKMAPIFFSPTVHMFCSFVTLKLVRSKSVKKMPNF